MNSKLASDAVQPEVLQKYEQDCVSANAQLAGAAEELRAAEVQLGPVTRPGPYLPSGMLIVS
jgi:hypothetical protein